MPDTARCPSCGEPHPQNAAFCGECGLRLASPGGKDTLPTDAIPVELAPLTSPDGPAELEPATSAAMPAHPAEEAMQGNSSAPAAARAADNADSLKQRGAAIAKSAGTALVSEAAYIAKAHANHLLPPGPTPAPKPVSDTAPTPPSQTATTWAGAAANYEYQMFQIPPGIQIKGAQRGQEAAAYLEEICNRFAGTGWEFFRIDTISVTQKPGCIGILLGLRGISTPAIDYYVITFRRPRRG